MNREPCSKWTATSDSELRPQQVAQRLGAAFGYAEADFNVGRMRERRRSALMLDALRAANAPDSVLAHWTDRLNQVDLRTAQVTDYTGTPWLSILELTVRPRTLHIYFAGQDKPHAERGAQLLDCVPDDDASTLGDERTSLEEQQYWDACQNTRQFLAESVHRFEGALATFRFGNKSSKVRVHDLEILEPYFQARVTMVPTPGMWNGLQMTGIRWRWWEFAATIEEWIRGPHVVESFRFDEAS